MRLTLLPSRLATEPYSLNNLSSGKSFVVKYMKFVKFVQFV